MPLIEKIKTNSFLLITFKICLLLLIVFIFDLVIGKSLRHLYFKQQFGRQYRATFAIDKEHAQVVVFGASRAYHHYVPSIIEDNLKLSCYNAGSPGQSLMFNYAIFTAILKRYKPKIVILDINPQDIRIDKDSYDRLSFLLPYYKDHAEIRPIVSLKSPFEKLKLSSNIYPYNSAFLISAGGNLEYFRRKSVDFNGYKPLDGLWREKITTRYSNPSISDSIKLNIYKSFISDCKVSGIELVVTCSPAYFLYEPMDYNINFVKKIAEANNVPFYNFLNDTTFINHPNLFDDPDHLNGIGSNLFTSIFVGRLQKKSINIDGEDLR